MTSRFRTSVQDGTGTSRVGPLSKVHDQPDVEKLPQEPGASDTAVPIQLDSCPLIPRTKESNLYSQKRLLINRMHLDDEIDEKKKRTFCRSWCDMWFLLAQSRVSCVILNSILFGGGLLVILLTVFGGLMDCPELTGAVVFLILTASLSIALGFLCCCYHWVRNNDDLPFGIFCIAYCLLFLFICVTLSGTVIVFTRIHPVGPDQPPPDIKNNSTVNVLSCGMAELPFGILIICYFLAILFLMISYCACILALGYTSSDD